MASLSYAEYGRSLSQARCAATWRDRVDFIDIDVEKVSSSLFRPFGSQKRHSGRKASFK